MLSFIIILILYFLPSFFFQGNEGFYNSLDHGIFKIPEITFSIVWTILYVIMALFFAIMRRKAGKTFFILFFINYVLNISFYPVFMGLENLYLSACITVLSFSTGLMLFLEALKIKRKWALLLLPYLLWTLFASILAINLFLLN